MISEPLLTPAPRPTVTPALASAKSLIVRLVMQSVGSWCSRDSNPAVGEGAHGGTLGLNLWRDDSKRHSTLFSEAPTQDQGLVLLSEWISQ